MSIKLSHLDDEGKARMVDTSEKPVTVREAVAKACVRMSRNTFALVEDGAIKKGDVLTVAEIAGVQASKRTSELIPLCHPIPLTYTGVEISLNETESCVDILTTCRTTAKTGVEMEALTAASVAALTVYDMCKAVERDIRITDIRLVRKSGGRSGEWVGD